MPVKGLFDERGLGAGLPLIGRLRKGGKAPTKDGQGERPVDLDYFRVTFEPQYAHLQPLWNELYGDKPTEFSPVFLVGQSVDDCFEYWKEEWDVGGTLLHRCDGEHQHAWTHPETFQWMTARVPCAAPKCECDLVGRLKLVIPDFLDEAGLIGYFAASTGSIRDIATIYLYLRDIQATMGNLARIPFVFGRADQKVNTPKQTKQKNGEYAVTGRIQVEKSLFYIHVLPEYAQMRVIPVLTGALPAPALTGGEAQPRLSAEEAKRLLGAGAGETRRIGATETPTERPATAWDYQAVINQTSGMFGDPTEQELLLTELIRADAVTSDMTTAQVIDELRFAALGDKNNNSQTFTAISLTCHAKPGGKGKASVYYWIQTAEGTAVYAPSRDIFREAKITDKQMADWNTPNTKHELPFPFKLCAERKTHQQTNEAYWSAAKVVLEGEVA